MNREKENQSKYDIKPTKEEIALNGTSFYGSAKSVNPAKSGKQEQLPPLKEANKFSSWTDNSLFDQVDDILFEGETSDQAKRKVETFFGSNKKESKSMNKDSLLSLSGSLDLDSYDIGDVIKNSNSEQRQFKKEVNKDSNSSDSNGGSIIADSLDLDNSDDLNKIIQKYEQMLGQVQTQQKLEKRSLEESWGAQEIQTLTQNSQRTQMNKNEEEYEYDDFEQSIKSVDKVNKSPDNQDDDKIVDEEIYMNSSFGKNDSEFLQELLNQPLRQKAQPPIKEGIFTSLTSLDYQCKSAASKVIASLEENNDQDEVEEFIRKHSEEKENQPKAVLSSSASSSSSSSSSSDGVFEKDKRTPKQVLLDELKKLSDVYTKYSLTDREMFLSDLENILKILTYDETVSHVISALQIYANEQEFLKLQFFSKLPFVFKKLFKHKEQMSQTLDIINIQILPLITKILINSEEQVQTEGVDALIKISKDSLRPNSALDFITDIVEFLMTKADQQEAAKVAVLIFVEKFADENLFTQSECTSFLDRHLQVIQKGMLFKIKKFLLTTLLAMSNHLVYDRFIDQVYNLYLKFCSDDIWGVRKVCIERLQDIVKLLNFDEGDKLGECLLFLKACLNDGNRWVKIQAFINFGYIIHGVYQKMNQSSSQQGKILLKYHLSQICDLFYDQKFISHTEEENSICQSFMANSNDDVDKIKYYWAFFSGCVLLINGGEEYWQSTLKPIYERLYKDLQINVRKTLASSLVEVMKLVDMRNPENQEFFMKVIQQFNQDIEEVKTKVSPQLCEFITLYPEEQHVILLNTMIRDQISSLPTKGQRDSKLQLLEHIYRLFPASHLGDQDFHTHLLDLIDNEPAIQYKLRACKILGAHVIAPLIKSKKYRKQLTAFLDKLRGSANFRRRQLYLAIAKATFKANNEIFKKHFAKAIGLELIDERVAVVQIALAKLCRAVPVGYSKSIEKVRQIIQKRHNYGELKQYLDKEEFNKKAMIVVDEGEGKEEKDQQSEEEEERLQYEKTVQIKFANYSLLAKTNQSELGVFNTGILAFLGGMISQGKSDIFDKSEEALLKGNDSWAN